ncbi:MAG: MBL fold metallo-hydrolase [Gammaproteobacteria bacterium]|nr:MBL fold metallo-hydrolase [Gammaproteobacteria bacterium]
MKKFKLFILIFCMYGSFSYASEKQNLVLKKVDNNVWSIVGPLTNRDKENLGNNATFGFVVTDEGIVVIDSGGSFNGAKAIHEIIKTVSNKPVRYVINSGGQDHRWFGNDYFSSLGAKIISSEAAKKDHQTRSSSQWSMLETLIGAEGIKGTKEKFADIVFKADYKFTLGNIQFEVYHRGQAHTPGDAFIWLPQSKVMFTGDIVYTERMLGIGEQSKSKTWLASFDAMASHKPQHIVPGHGSPTTLNIAIKDTRDYIAHLRNAIAVFIEQGGDASDISKINQSKFNYLSNFDTLSGRNALKVYTELEWE